ncbi:flavin reductase [Arthrobacter bambusae]|uniref:flavin reductase n=1 Tax=Arthrobacter bambusae TaxID=1338426 RepID=UPI0027876CEA|nr:flavin reductase [Arthrobacter bambusae]MDQ0239550.1 flavin reductase (DIM6/NTAB) family NADH-FMN oxidoreductase RutF/DNA-binding IclR family transcriptional regulator [Arthrobacter bambusae]
MIANTQAAGHRPTASSDIDPAHFRRVLGNYPTGVCVITAVDPESGPVGMTVGSFSSVSLGPALVSFMPASGSRTFAQIRSAGRFCVNVLSAEQGDVCRRFAKADGDRFADLPWYPSPSGAPVIEGSLAWIDCRLDTVYPGGDHAIVVGAVESLDISDKGGAPLLFFQGGYGRFSDLTLTAAGDENLPGKLVLADLARPRIEAISRQFAVDCCATGLVADNLIQLAFSGSPDQAANASKVGLRLPFLPPMGALFIAWDEERSEQWITRGLGAGNEVDDITRSSLITLLEAIRERGWLALPALERLQRVETLVARLADAGPLPAPIREISLLLRGVPESFVREEASLTSCLHSLSVPVFDHQGQVVLMLTATSLEDRSPESHIPLLESLLYAAADINASLGGRILPSGRNE